MITCAVSVAERNWQEWLHAVSNMRVIRTVEFPASVLADVPEAREAAEKYGIDISHARDLLPPETASYLAEKPVRGRDDVMHCLKTALLQCHLCGVRCACLQLGLNRIGEQTIEQDLAERLRLLRGLIPAAEDHAIVLCVQVRHPPSFPDSREWDYASNLVHEIMHPKCRLAVNVVPSELPPEFDIQDFVRTCYFQMGVLRFFYSPAMGEELDAERQAEWATALQRYSFKGTVVFRSQVREEEGIVEACGRVDQIAELYGK